MSSGAKSFFIFGEFVDPVQFPTTFDFLKLSSSEINDYLISLKRWIKVNELQSILFSALKRLYAEKDGYKTLSRNVPALPLWSDDYKSVSLSSSLGAFDFNDSLISAEKTYSGGILPSFSHPVLMAQFGKDPIPYTRYRFNPAEGLEVFQRGCELVRLGDDEISGGSVRLFDDPCEVIEFKPLHGQDHLILTVALLAVEFPLVWLFDRINLVALRALSPSSAASRAELIMKLFEELHFDGASELLQSWLTSPFHFLRWRAVQSLLKLHPIEGIEAVKLSLQDKHPHVSNAAKRTYSNLLAQGLV